MLDDGHSCSGLGIELRHQLNGRVGVGDVVIAEGLALHLAGGGHPGPWGLLHVEGGGLVRVLAIAKGLGQAARQGPPPGCGLAQLAREPGRNRRIVGRRAGVGPGRQGLAQDQARGSLRRQLGQDLLQVLQFGADRHIAMVLGRRADHRGTADVDVLDGAGEVAPAGHRLLEGVEVDVDEVDPANPVLGHGGGVGRGVAHAQEAAVHHRVQGLDPAVHHLRKAGQVRDVLHGQPCSGDARPGAARRHQLHAPFGQGPGGLDQPRLVGHRDQGPADGNAIRRRREVRGGRHGALRGGSEGRPRRAAL